MSQAGQKIIDGLKDAIAGNFSRVTIKGQTWMRRNATEWQPIETAPKDATGVWLIVDGQPCLGYWDPNDAPWAAPKWFVKAAFRRRGRAGKIVTDEIFGIYAHAHWMPLPDPPAPHPGVSDTHRMPVGDLGLTETQMLELVNRNRMLSASGAQSIRAAGAIFEYGKPCPASQAAQAADGSSITMRPSTGISTTFSRR